MSFNTLEQRGIAQIAQAHGWCAEPFKNQSGWAFPIYHPITGDPFARRWKSSDSRGMKYAWLPSKPNLPLADWYILPNTLPAIAKADGTAYLANGEPALLAYHAAGIHNVIATTLSEVGIPQMLLMMLDQFGIRRLLYPVDNDAAGEKSALNWRDELRGTGVDFQAFTWGENAPEKADANDIWIALDFSADAFQEHLQSLDPLPLPLPEIKQNYDDDIDFEQTPQGLIDMLANRLGITAWKSNGWARKNISSPFREDKKPSATFNRHSGVLHDFGTGESYSPVDVAKELGIDWKAYYPQKQKSVYKARPKFDDSVTRVTVPLFHADKTVNLRYISDLPLSELGQTNAIRSPLATGKTSLIAKIIRNTNPDDKILVITHLQALAENISERLSRELDVPVECYQHIPHEYRESAYRLVCSYDSLHTISDNWDYVFIDEHEQFHRHLTSGTMRGGEPLRAYEKLMTIVRGAKHVTALDAHMSVASSVWLTTMRGSVTNIMNSYRHHWDRLTLHKSESALLASAFAAAEGDTRGVVIPCNSRSKTQDYYQLAVERFGEDAVMLINGENSSSRDARQFIRDLTDPNNEGKSLSDIFHNLRVLICSPSLATGIDVQAQVSGVYGVFTQQSWVNACNILQMMMRYRQADQRQMCIMGSSELPEMGIQWENAMDEALEHHRQRMAGTAAAADFHRYGIEGFSAIQQMITSFVALFESETKHQQQALQFFVEVAADDEGFDIEYSDSYVKSVREALKQARAKREDAFKQAVLTADLVSPEDFDALRQNPDSTSEQLREARAGLERWQIEFTSGQTITPTLFDTLGNSRRRADFNRLVDLLDEPELLKHRDREEAQIGVLVIKRKHYIRNRDLIDMAGRQVFGDDWLNSEEVLTADEIAGRLDAFLRTHLQEIQQYIDKRFDLSDEPINIFRRLLKRVGLKLGRTQLMRDGERFYIYFMDGKHRRTILGYAATALEARLIRELLQSRSILINIREWSNPAPDNTQYHEWKAQVEATIANFRRTVA